MKMTARVSLSVLTLALLPGCGGSRQSAEGANDVTCPPGQSYDGQFCQVDQNVATAEQPLPGQPSEKEPAPEVPPTEEPGEPAFDTPSAEEKPAPESEPADPQEVPPSQATPVDVTMAAQAGPIIQYLASSHLPSGARQMGAPFAGQFAEKQILEQKMQLTSGKCYTVVAVGLPPVAEVNLELFSEGATEPVAKDDTVGVQAVLGSRSSCFQPKTSGPFRLVLSVDKGQGVAAAQVFQK